MRGDEFEEAPERFSSNDPYSDWPRSSIDYVLAEEKTLLSPAKPTLNQDKKSPHLLIRSAIEATESGFQIETPSNWMKTSANQNRA